jgi:cell surface protein SprA
MQRFINRKLFFVFFTLMCSTFVLAQSNEDPEVNTNAQGYNINNIRLKNPKSIVGAYTYDPVTDKYIYNNKFGEVYTTYPKILTPEAYYEIIRKEQIRKYFKDKISAIEGKGKDSLKRRDLIPTLYVRSSIFETIFGGNQIKMTPRGNVELDLGLMHTTQDNPILSPRNRSQTTFDFNQRVQVGLNGTIGTRLNINMQYDTQATFSFQNLIKVSYNPSGQFGDLLNQGQQAAGMGRDALSKGQQAVENPLGTAANEANKNANEDTILKNIEFGNINMPLNNTLIRGAQNLFGGKAQFQFGKTHITTVFSEQRSQNRSITAQGGGTLQDFEIFGLDYDADRHFFLSHYFRNNYDRALREYPYINSRVQITRVEVWITNRQNNVNPGQNGNNLRNILALQDLGEGPPSLGVPDSEVVVINPTTGFFTVPANSPTDNKNNLLDPRRIETGSGLLNSNARQIVTASSGFNFTPVSEGTHYSKLENARKLNPNEYNFHPQLGYVSLQQRLTNDEVLAVAYQYTIGDQVFQVGEFGNDGVDNSVVDPGNSVPATQSLILKKLKSTLTFASQPIFDLMMKNIYQIPSGFNLAKEDFKLNVLHLDPAPLNYLNSQGGLNLPAGVADTPLLNVFNVDKLDNNNDPQNGGDGFFDFMPGLTIDAQNGRVIFTTVEPFGRHLFNKLSTGGGEDYNVLASYNANQAKYVFSQMYTSTQAGALQNAEKNKFVLRGRFKAAGGGGIPIGGFNLPRGSVIVTAGGRRLIEGVDYTVNYQQGRVNILDPSLQNSNTPINISVENNAVFGQQTRRFWGVDIEHRFNEKFKLGATYLRLSERPFTQKATFGQESVNNTIFGFNGDYSTEVPFLTRLVNKLPYHDTDVASNLSLRGEVAFLRPDSPSLTDLNNESTIYVEDFEGSQSTIDMSSPFSWSLSSTPIGSLPTSPYNFNGNAPENDLTGGFKRSKLSWYTIDPLFFTSQRPGDMTDADFSLNKTRRVFIDELFPVTDVIQGETRVVNTLDLAYFPRERGPYNFNPAYGGSNAVPDPQTNFGGIMRGINTTNFEQSNVEYIQFWMMDPYQNNEHPTTNTGRLIFNLGEISEDILKDGRKQYENGLPEVGSVLPTIENNWGKVPATQSLIYAFDTNEGNRAVQDIGLDGLTNAEEAAKFPPFAGLPDPSADDYQFFLTASGNLTQRYKNYNGLERNTPIEVTDTNRGNTTFPDVEDVNRDNTMNTINAYFEYEVNVGPSLGIGSPYVTDVKETTVTTNSGEVIPTRWVQMKIPVFEFTRKQGDIEDFRSIRFMRMFMTGFTDEITLRLGTLELIRADWRRFEGNMQTELEDPTGPDNDDTQLDVLAVNILENQSRQPIPYVLPPGVVREQLNTQNTVVNQNEQSLSLRVTKKPGDVGAGVGGLEPGDSRGVFKAVDVDMRQFKKMRMFLHAEAIEDNVTDIRLRDDEMSAFIRFGNDFSDNFYQIEVPLKVTAWGETSPDRIWPLENEMEVKLELLTKLKILYRQNPPTDPNQIFYINEVDLDPSAANKTNAKLRLGIKGNPNFGFVRMMMMGVKNNRTGTINTHSTRGEVWFNELRLSEMDNKGGMAAILNVDSNLADFATISATGRMSTIGFGALEDKSNERSREDLRQYDFVTNVSLGKLFPKKWGLTIPFNYALGEKVITPEYDPYNQDIRLDQLIENTPDQAQRDIIRDRAIDYTLRQSINFIGVRKDRGEQQKQRIYDIENFTFSHSYNKEVRHNFEIDDYEDKQTRSAVDYAYTFKNKPIEPFKKSKIKDKRYWKLLSDFNVNYLPSNINFNTNIIRHYNRQRFREVENFGLPLRPLFRRNYMFNYTYGFNFNLTKSLRINYNASTNNIVRNFIDENNNPNNENVIWDDYFNPGIADRHNQQLTVNYELPLNKLPFLSFLKANYTYTGNYQWQRASTQMSNFVDENNQRWNLGNNIQNSGSHRINSTLTMSEFYKYVGLTGPKKAKTPAKPEPPKVPKPGEKIENKAPKPATSEENLFVKTAKGLLMSIKTVQGTYEHNTGVSLPGFLEGIGFFGSTRPSLPFTLGLYDDVRFEAARKGWLTVFPEFNMPYTEVETRRMNFTAKIEPIPDLTIDLMADQNRQDNFSEQFDVSNGIYNSRSPYNFGNFTSSTIMINTAFGQSDEVFSKAFEDFRSNRLVVANRLAERFYGTPNFPVITDPASSNIGYPVGFGRNQQEVLASAFMAAYLGTDASSINTSPFRNLPLPNWNIKYTGFMRLKFMKDLFKRFSIEHGYRSSYTINAHRSNLAYNNPQDPTNTDVSGNLLPQTLLGNINMVEQFNPLIRVDFELKNSFNIRAEMRKDRALSLSFDNALLTEVQGVEYTIGAGYRIKDIIIRSRLADNPEGFFKSDLNIMANFSFRDNKTIVRYLDFDNNQLGGGQNLWSFRLTADYAFTRSLSAIFTYDHTFNQAVISTAFPVTNIRSFLTIRYSLGN